VEGEIEEEARESEEAVAAPDGLDGVFAGLEELGAVDVFEFLRERVGESAIEAQAGGDGRGGHADGGRRGHGIDDAVGDFLAVIDLRELREDTFERGLLHEVAEMLDGIVGGDFALAEDEDGGADFLDDFEDVRTVEDDFAARGEGA